MKPGEALLSALLAVVFFAPIAGVAQFSPEQGFMGSSAPVGSEGFLAASGAPDSSLYADGTRAINEGRWSDAEAIFAKVAGQNGEHADGAIYWKAYAENKRGQAKDALDACADLRLDYPASSWVNECGALEIEIHARSGKPLAPNAAQDDDLRLLALNSLLKTDEPRALAEIQEILNGDSSEKLKKEAQFILGNHYSDATYPQIVRLSYVEGDVRVARGERNEKVTGATWEQAVSGIPLETGFSLATGAGRAEIELENASTLYLGENSVLTFNDLHTTAGVPNSQLSLLTGTATLNVRPYVAGEQFTLKTPSRDLTVIYPHKPVVRVTSYFDATAITPLSSEGIRVPEVSQAPQVMGHTILLHEGYGAVELPESSAPGAFADWDKWVADRIAKRSAATAEVMQASGLTAPIPGLAEMNGQGKFFECQPYGTCWEPSTVDDRQQAGDKQPESGAPSNEVSTSHTETKQVGSRTRTLAAETDLTSFFPCFPEAVRYQTETDPVTGKQRVISSPYDTGGFSYAWAVCHAGSWIHQRHHYVWVVGHKRHHIAPVRWIKCGHTVAFVPLHPYDVKGRPAINRREEALAVSKRNGISLERVKFDAKSPMEFLQSPPREFRSAHQPPLSGAGDPHLEARLTKDVFEHKGDMVKTPGVPLIFDHKSQSFMANKQVMRGDKSVTITAPISNRFGDLQSRAPSYSGGGSYHGGGGASSYSGGGSRGGGGGSSGGGGSHGGGGGGSYGGGSHGGGGGGGGSSSGGGSHGGGGGSGSGSGGSHGGGGGGSSSSSSASSSAASSSSASSSAGSSSSGRH
jgi:hypothetical protein